MATELGITPVEEIVVRETFSKRSLIPDKYNPFRLMRGLLSGDSLPYAGAVMGAVVGAVISLAASGSREAVLLGVGSGIALGFIFGVIAQRNGSIETNRPSPRWP